MIFNREEYAKSGVVMPDRDNKKIKKDRAYYLQVSKYIYSEFCRGATLITTDYYNGVRERRAYALGAQDSSKYQDMFFGKESNNNTLEAIVEGNRGARRKAYANLNFEIQSPMPRVMDGVVNKLVELVNRVSVDATDAYSGAERENAKWGAFVDGKYKQEFGALKALAALPQEDQGYTPRSIEELNLYEAEGGFKLTYEEVMERLLKFSFDQSYWEENIIERIISDLVVNGFACAVDVYDKHAGLVKAKYVDCEYAGVQYTKQDSNNNPDFGFYVDMVKISELRRKGIKDENLEEMCKIFSAQFGNPSMDDWNKQNKQSGTKDYTQLDKWVVPVFVTYFKDIEYKSEKKYNNRQGKYRTKDVPNDYKPKQGEEIIDTRLMVVSEAHWVIGTEYVYDYGKAEFQARDGFAEPVLPIHMVQVTGRPIVSRLIPSLDQYMNAWMRLQQGINMAAMNGYAINMDAVSNLSLGGKKLDPREVIRIWRQTGTLFFKPTDVAGRMNAGMTYRPIEQLPGGAGAVIVESVQMMDIAMKQIEELTGINPVSMGVQPEPNQGKAVTEYAIMGTNDVLKGVLRKANIIKSDTARNMCLRIQRVVQSDKRAFNAYKDVVGETSLEVIKIANGHDVKYGIRTHARPTESEVRAIDEMLGLSLKNGRDGKVGITEADYIRFKSMMASGASLKRIALLLDFANQKAQQEAEARSQRAQQLDQQGAQQLDAQKAQNEMRSLMMKAQAEIAVENVKGRNDVLVKAVGDGMMSAQQALYIIQGSQAPQQAPPQQQPQQGVGQPQSRTIPIQEDAV